MVQFLISFSSEKELQNLVYSIFALTKDTRKKSMDISSSCYDVITKYA